MFYTSHIDTCRVCKHARGGWWQNDKAAPLKVPGSNAGVLCLAQGHVRSSQEVNQQLSGHQSALQAGVPVPKPNADRLSYCRPKWGTPHKIACHAGSGVMLISIVCSEECGVHSYLLALRHEVHFSAISVCSLQDRYLLVFSITASLSLLLFSCLLVRAYRLLNLFRTAWDDSILFFQTRKTVTIYWFYSHSAFYLTCLFASSRVSLLAVRRDPVLLIICVWQMQTLCFVLQRWLRGVFVTPVFKKGFITGDTNGKYEARQNCCMWLNIKVL